jgi:hypothetical protein
MIRHIVLFKIKPEYKEQIPTLIENFRNMRGRIDGLLSLDAGQDILGSERSYDLALVCVFRDRAAFDAYQKPPRPSAREGEDARGAVRFRRVRFRDVTPHSTRFKYSMSTHNTPSSTIGSG